MGTLPFLPSGQAELPAERFLLFADTAHDVQRIDEQTATKDGTNFTGEWQSPNLNELMGIEATLSQIELFYSAIAATTMKVAVSKDGGETWEQEATINLAITAGKILRAYANFDVTGFDLRFRIRLDTNTLVNLYGFKPTLVDRGDLIF